MAESQTEADCVQLCCLVASPPQPILICTERSLRADKMLAVVFLLMHDEVSQGQFFIVTLIL